MANANEIDKSSPHYKGEFATIYDVNLKYPNGGVEGDVGGHTIGMQIEELGA